MPVTLKDVAKKAGVSVMTVSRIVNNQDSAIPISENTKAKVLEVVKTLNYTPNIMAKGLKSGKTHLVGLIVPGITNSFYAEIIQGIEDIVEDLEYSVILTTTDYKPDKEAKYLELLKRKQVDGLILMPLGDESNVRLIQEIKESIPLVFIVQYSESIKKVSTYKEVSTYVVVDHCAGALQATEHLIKLGHKRIAHLSAMPARLEGYKKALEQNGIRFEPELVERSGYGFEGGYQAMQKLLALDKLPTAVFCAGDRVALGAMKEIREKGLQVPDDVALVGFDDEDIASMVDVPLTTIAQPQYDLGRIAADKLMSLIRGEKVESSLIQPKLVIRESCGAHLSRRK